jgi:hypothetical protein|tara:strand:- start:2590 stop:2838 length:249 start_codon:yes stop_codon:yes gene_type:complete
MSIVLEIAILTFVVVGSAWALIDGIRNNPRRKLVKIYDEKVSRANLAKELRNYDHQRELMHEAVEVHQMIRRYDMYDTNRRY